MRAALPLRYHSEPLTAAQQQQLLDLYQQAIDPREQKPRATLAAALARGDYRWQVACRGDELLAFALLWDDGEVALLEYLAVADELRSLGVGGQLLAAVVAMLGGRPLLLEVDDDGPQAPEQAQRQRRRRFYERHGARRIGSFNYQLPLPGPQPAMMLMILGWPQPAVPLALLADWLRRIYGGVYGQPESDPRLAAMVTNLAPQVLLQQATTAGG